MAQRDQLLRMRIRQRPYEHAIEYTENRGAGANADGQTSAPGFPFVAGVSEAFHEINFEFPSESKDSLL
jgi:hypothetical protein